MSVVYCHTCDKNIDTDYNAEHFKYNTEECDMFDDMDNVVNTFFAQADEFAQKLRDQDHVQDEREAEALDLLQAEQE